MSARGWIEVGTFRARTPSSCQPKCPMSILTFTTCSISMGEFRHVAIQIVNFVRGLKNHFLRTFSLFPLSGDHRSMSASGITTVWTRTPTSGPTSPSTSRTPVSRAPDRPPCWSFAPDRLGRAALRNALTEDAGFDCRRRFLRLDGFGEALRQETGVSVVKDDRRQRHYHS